MTTPEERELWSKLPSVEQIALLWSHVTEDDQSAIDLKDEAHLAILLIEHFRLVVRPDLFHGWWCSRFKSVRLDGKSIEYEMETLVWSSELCLAVFWSSLKVIEVDQHVIKAPSLDEVMKSYQESLRSE